MLLLFDLQEVEFHAIVDRHRLVDVGRQVAALGNHHGATRERLAVVETKLELLARRVEKMDASGEDTNRMVRLLSVARGINPDAKER